MTTTYIPILCPCGCGETVTLTMGGFATTSVEVTACTTLAGTAGIVSYTMRKSAALGFTATGAALAKLTA